MASKIFLVAGLAYGDEGKGATVDYLVRRHKAGLVVRYNGGCQAAHNVVLKDGRHHTFAQFGSGTFVPGCRTYLSEYMLINPISMLNEEHHLRELGVEDAFERTWVHEDALIVTPFHRAVNRLTEWSLGANAHGSCGLGVGAAREFHIKHGRSSLFAGDLRDPSLTRTKLKIIQDTYQEFISTLGSNWEVPANKVEQEIRLLTLERPIDLLCRWYQDWVKLIKFTRSVDLLIDETETAVFEGAQGALLDETHGGYPFNTWTNTTFENAFYILRNVAKGAYVRKIGCLRTYFTRHGAGPFQEDPSLAEKLPEPHNSSSGFQGKFRVGKFDYKLARWGIEIVAGVDEIALSHMDCLSSVTDWSPMVYVNYLENRLNTRVNIVGVGPLADDRAELLRAWE